MCAVHGTRRFHRPWGNMKGNCAARSWYLEWFRQEIHEWEWETYTRSIFRSGICPEWPQIMKCAVMLCRELAASQKSKLEHNIHCDTSSKLFEWRYTRSVDSLCCGHNGTLHTSHNLPADSSDNKHVLHGTRYSKPASGQQQCQQRASNIQCTRQELSSNISAHVLKTPMRCNEPEPSQLLVAQLPRYTTVLVEWATFIAHMGGLETPTK